ncbi:unnamed protein product [Phyllotreta striolata]|uniref:Cationic amino acid transporter C-terminal domain-containing protein n=1 Tax=Phyllotreta striolata TaxID=444603 RepID=A0A9N9TUI4_PHYSR|nr:unnamed protein product [Phyllotreta striolata]
MEYIKMVTKVWTAITRKKRHNDEIGDRLARILTLVDLIAMGTGATLGLGVYVLAGSVAKNYAGPASAISFVLAALISLFGGFCYAEFAARVPRTGYAYAYCYAGVGELVAFLVGWNLLLGAMLGIASVASGMSSYIDTLFDSRIKTTLGTYLGINVPYLSSSPDILALGIIIFITVLLSIGIKESSRFNNLCTILNLLTIVTVVIACSIKADIKNWRIPLEKIPEQYRQASGDGGFLPFGVAGVIAGTPNCFFGFTGFDAPANCSEEAKRPKRDIPLAILISLLIVFVTYFTLSVLLTLAYPYYLQNEEAPFPHVFAEFGWDWVKWIVTIGAIFALSASVFGAMYMVPRVFYAMANDGLIFKFFGSINPRTKTPQIATIFSGAVSGIMATFLDINELMDLMTIGAFFSYVIVASSVLILRYEHKDDNIGVLGDDIPRSYLRSIFTFKANKIPNRITSIIANISVFFFIIVTAVFCVIFKNESFFSSTRMYYICCSIMLAAMVIIILIIFRQPESDVKIPFKVPLVPFIPCLSVIFNLYLMLQLSAFTWTGFVSWIFIGSLVYFCYGIKNSEENNEKGIKSIETSVIERKI